MFGIIKIGTQACRVSSCRRAAREDRRYVRRIAREKLAKRRRRMMRHDED